MVALIPLVLITGEVIAFGVEDAAEKAVVAHAADRLEIGTPVQLEANQALYPARVDCSLQLAKASEVIRRRFFNQDVLASFCGGDPLGYMQVVHRANVDDVDPGIAD